MARFLSDSDVSVLKKVIEKVNRMTGGSLLRSHGDHSFNEAVDHQAPEVYIVKADVDIEARDGTDIVYGDCTIQYIKEGTGSTDSLYSNFHKLRVHNASSKSISAEDIFPVKRTKHGKWIPDEGGGVQELIEFLILDEKSCESNCCDVRVTAVPCSGGVVSVGDILTVEDRQGCFLNIDPTFLVGAKGTAVKWNQAPGCDYETGTCTWAIISLCRQVAACP